MSSIIELMTAGEFRDLQVGEEGQSFGIVWIGDVVKYRVRRSNSNPRAYTTNPQPVGRALFVAPAAVGVPIAHASVVSAIEVKKSGPPPNYLFATTVRAPLRMS